jgi:hypothetical protein
MTTFTLALNLAPHKRYKIPDRINAEKSACVYKKIQSQIGFMSAVAANQACREMKKKEPISQNSARRPIRRDLPCHEFSFGTKFNLGGRR